MAKMIVPSSCSLRFVNRTYYDRTIANPINRLYPDYIYQGRFFYPYFQKFEQGDSVWFQVLTDYTDFQLYLVNCATGNSTNIRSTLDYKTQVNGLSLYECIVNISALSGKYYIDLRGYAPGLPYIQFLSETFNVAVEWENTLLMKWQGNTNMNDGMYWDKFANLRVEGKIVKTDYKTNKNTYDDSNYELITLRDNPNLSYRLDVRLIPNWIAEKINLAVGHDEFWCNDLLLNTSEALELENFNGSTLFKGQLMMRQVVYENYKNLEELEGTPPVFVDEFLMISDTDYLLINATDKLKLNN